jgi:hypothetical protein
MSLSSNQPALQRVSIATTIAALAFAFGFSLVASTGYADDDAATNPVVLQLPGGHGVVLNPSSDNDSVNNTVRLEITGEQEQVVLFSPTLDDNRIRFDDDGVLHLPGKKSVVLTPRPNGADGRNTFDPVLLHLPGKQVVILALRTGGDELKLDEVNIELAQTVQDFRGQEKIESIKSELDKEKEGTVKHETESDSKDAANLGGAMGTLESHVAEAQVIVVATGLGPAPKGSMRWEVNRVLKGEFDKKEFSTISSMPVAESNGKEWIVSLWPEYFAGDHERAAYTHVKFEPTVKKYIANEKAAVDAAQWKAIAPVLTVAEVLESKMTGDVTVLVHMKKWLRYEGVSAGPREPQTMVLSDTKTGEPRLDVLVDWNVFDRLKALGIADPKKHFVGKQIVIAGKVVRARAPSGAVSTYINIDELDQIVSIGARFKVNSIKADSLEEFGDVTIEGIESNLDKE